MTGLARGETELIINEFPGRPAMVLKMHKDFHIGITTNDPESTPGRETLPAEILAVSQVIDVPNRYSRESYLAIIKRFHSKFITDRKGAPLADWDALAETQLNFHLAMIEFVEKMLDENEERHLLTLRDLKNWVRAAAYFHPSDNNWFQAFDLVYLRQFNAEDRARIVQHLRRGGLNHIPVREEVESEAEIVKHMKEIADIGLHTLLMMEPGAREQEIVDGFAAKEGYDVYDLESSPEMTALELLGGAFPVFEGEEGYGLRDFRVKPAFLTRHLVPEGQENVSGPKKLLVIHNMDALPERVRALLNNFLIKGYVYQRDDAGRMVKLVLPRNVKIVATMSALSQREFSSAFFNRFVKLNVPAMEARDTGKSEVLGFLMKNYGLHEREARKVENLFLMIRSMEFVKLALQEAAARGETLDIQDRERVIIEEAIRVYGAALKENPKDFDVFVRILLEQLFRNVARSDLTGAVTYRAEGVPSGFAGVGINAKAGGVIDARVRLTLVPKIVNTLSTILRGWQAGKMVSLIGETAAAKTTMGRYLAQLMGFDFYLYSAHAQSKARDLTAALALGEDGKYRLEIREFLERIQKDRQVVILDEINLKPEILWILNGIARGQRLSRAVECSHLASPSAD